jgi:hypothetical protein
MRSKRIFIFLFLAYAFTAHSFGQVATSTYDNDGLKFSYPSDWTLTDRSSPETQHLLLSKPGTLLLIVIVSPRETLIDSKQF